MKRVFVTGATGFIGAAVARRLLADGYEVAILARPESSRQRLGRALDRMHVISGSCDSPAAFARPLEDFRPDTVMHLAWHGVGGAHRNAPDQIRKNVCAAIDLLETAAKAGCRTFVGAGSQAEYGPSRDVLHEQSPVRPVTAYGAAKLATSILLAHLAALHDVRFAWLRIFSVFGPGDDAGTLFSYVTTDWRAGRCPAVSTGEHAWDSLYLDDAAAAFITAAESQATGVINVASGHSPPLRDTISKVRDAIDPSLPIVFGTVADPPSGAYPLRANVDRLRNLGWRPATPLDDAIERTVSWYRHRGAM
ncbi:MAG: NAD-dependent epimerase/dehydratase family protein [Planctomycetaceae bacterium]